MFEGCLGGVRNNNKKRGKSLHFSSGHMSLNCCTVYYYSVCYIIIVNLFAVLQAPVLCSFNLLIILRVYNMSVKVNAICICM